MMSWSEFAAIAAPNKVVRAPASRTNRFWVIVLVLIARPQTQRVKGLQQIFLTPDETFIGKMLSPVGANSDVVKRQRRARACILQAFQTLATMMPDWNWKRPR